MDRPDGLLAESAPRVAASAALDAVTTRIARRPRRRGIVIAGLVSLSLAGGTTVVAANGPLDELIDYYLNNQPNDQAWEMDITGTDGTQHCIGGIVIMPHANNLGCSEADYLAIKRWVQNRDWFDLEPHRSLLHPGQRYGRTARHHCGPQHDRYRSGTRLRPALNLDPRNRHVLAEVALRANQADILACLVRRVDNREDAADLFGDAYLTAWRKQRQMPADAEGARNWLFVIARNTLLNYYRSSRRRRGLTNALHEELRESHDDPTEQNLEVRRAIASLGGKQAELVRLVHWEGLRIVDAAEVIGIPSSTARSRYATARASLAKLLSASLIA